MTRVNPYIGPRSFKTGEPLYGRDGEIEELSSLLMAERIVLLHSPSGAGKTSIIQAGLIPGLKEDFNILPTVRVNLDMPDTGAANRYILSVILSLEEGVDVSQRQSQEVLNGLSLDAYLTNRLRAKNIPGLDLLIFDQFEEILTSNPMDSTGKELFFTQLGEALRNRNRWALFAIREDYLGPLDPYLLPIPNRLKTTFRLDLLGINAASQAIQSPAQQAGVEYTVEALQLFLDDLRTVQTQQSDGTTHTELGQYIEPVQLQVVCYRLWENLADDDMQISENDVSLAGNVNTALSIYYADCIRQVSQEIDIKEKFIRQWFNDKLITAQGIRGQVLKSVGESEGLDNTVIARLIDAHLVRAERRAGAVWYELAHDRLIQPVYQDNTDWYTKNLNSLQIQGDLWAKSSGTLRSTLLFRDTALEKAEVWAREHPEELSSSDQDFLEECIKARDQVLAAQNRQVEMRTNLSETGWGVIFPAGEINPQLLEALNPLLELRRNQAGSKNSAYYREFKNEDGYRPGESADEFLARHKVSFKRRTEKVPYYLLIVADPETIPFEFQYSLSTRYAVGRIYFETLAEYSNYARSVGLTEDGKVALPRKASLWSVVNPDDRPTKMMFDSLTLPLKAFMDTSKPFANWEIELLTGEKTSKKSLGQLMSDPEAPALLFTAAHGMGFKMGDPRQNIDTGALICGEWLGPKARVPINSDLYFSAQDVPSDANLTGMIAFFYNGSSAGSPKYDDFSLQTFGTLKQIAERAFISRLPTRLLGHPRGGALAIIGHVERSWGSSVTDSRIGESEISTFEDLLSRLADGYTVGAAMESFFQRHAFLSTQLADLLFDIKRGLKEEDEMQTRSMFTNVIDARNYIILGDPAVRLPVAKRGQVPLPRPVLEQTFTQQADSTQISITLERDPIFVVGQKAIDLDETDSISTLPTSGDTAMEQKTVEPTVSQFVPAPMMTNGIDATTGKYILPPIDHHLIVQIARGQKIRPEDLRDAKLRYMLDKNKKHF